jgi:hypothetical protein
MRKSRIATSKGQAEMDERTPEEKFQEALEWAKQRRPQPVSGDAEARQTLADPSQFSPPGVRQMTQTPPGPASDELETFGKAVVNATSVTSRTLARLSAELGEAVQRVESIERDIEMRTHV